MNRYRKKRMIIAGTWLLFVVGSILLLLAVENGLCRSKAREKLLEQASVLESQLPGIAENQLYYQTGSSGQVGIGRGRNGLGDGILRPDLTAVKVEVSSDGKTWSDYKTSCARFMRTTAL